MPEGRILFIKGSPFGNPLVLERLLPGDFVAGFAVIFDFSYPTGAVSDCPSKPVGYLKQNLHTALEEAQIPAGRSIPSSGNGFAWCGPGFECEYADQGPSITRSGRHFRPAFPS